MTEKLERLLALKAFLASKRSQNNETQVGTYAFVSTVDSDGKVVYQWSSEQVPPGIYRDENNNGNITFIGTTE